MRRRRRKRRKRMKEKGNIRIQGSIVTSAQN